MFKKGDKIELEIENLAFGGKGVGSIDIDGTRFKVFIENVIPGDKIEAVFTRVKKNYTEAKVVRIIKESALRVEPKCKHFGVCGGCTWQNLDYKKQLEYKENQVRESLERLGKVSRPAMRKILGCENPWKYRNKMEFSLGGGGGLKLGLHQARMRYEIVDIEECFLVSELYVEIVRFVRDFFGRGSDFGRSAATVFNSKTREGFLRNLIIREAKTTGEIMVNLVTSAEAFGGREEFVIALKKRFGKNIVSACWTKIFDQKGRPKKTEEIPLFGASVIREKLNINGEKIKFDITPSAFFQPNTFQAQVLYETIFRLADVQKSDTVFDLFCGTGTIGICFAKFCGKVFGIEINESAIEAANKNAALNGLKNIQFLCGDAEKEVAKLQKLRERPDIIVVDPPRAGIGEKFAAKLARLGVKSGARKIIYVSCNPAALARDARILIDNGYKLTAVQPVDMFPHTYHIENIALFSRK